MTATAEQAAEVCTIDPHHPCAICTARRIGAAAITIQYGGSMKRRATPLSC